MNRAAATAAEQTQRGHWNKGVLFNRGVKYAESIGCDYVVMNDVDQLPVSDKILHEWPKVRRDL